MSGVTVFTMAMFAVAMSCMTVFCVSVSGMTARSTMRMTCMLCRRRDWCRYGRQCRASDSCAKGQGRGSTNQCAGAAGLLQELPSCGDRIGRAVVNV